MPIATHKPTKQIEPVAPVVTGIPKDYKSTHTPDLANAPLSRIVANIGGMPWTVDSYFNRLLSEHTDLSEIETTEPYIYQSYRKIVGLELRAQQSLSSSVADEGTGLMSAQGSAVVFGEFIPNLNDYFISGAGSRSQALYRVTKAQRLSITQQSVFEIDYQLVGFVQDHLTIVNALKSKIAQTYYYSRQRLMNNQTVLLSDEQQNNYTRLLDTTEMFIKRYFSDFFNPRASTLVLPGQSSVIYDPYLVNFLKKILEVEEAPQLRQMRSYDINNNVDLIQMTIWDAILEKDITILDRMHKELGYVNTKEFASTTYLRGIRYTGLEYIVYPIEIDRSAQSPQRDDSMLRNRDDFLVETVNREGDLSSAIDFIFTTESANYHVIKPVRDDDYYVLGVGFYEDTPTKTLLEVLTDDYINDRTISLTMLDEIIRLYPMFARLEQFYYGPIIIILLKDMVTRLK